MIYRDGKAGDWPKIEKFIDSTGYFPPIQCASLGGHWLVAEHNGEIVATIWCFHAKPHAYIDYFAGTGKTVATLAVLAEKLLREAGIRYVRGMVRSDNTAAIRLATEGVGMLTADNYNLVYKEITNGTAEIHDDGERATGGEAGEGTSSPAPAASSGGVGTIRRPEQPSGR